MPIEEKKKEIIRLNTVCITCIYNKFMNAVPCYTDEKTKLRYAKKILAIMANAADEVSAPEIVAECTKLKNETFGKSDDFANEKIYFNELMLGFEADITKKINSSEDPLRAAVCYALLGNYIDFGAMDRVDENKLLSLIDGAEGIDISSRELENLKTDLEGAKCLVYLTDNCGEIALDKLLINEIIRQYPRLDIIVLVRGENVLNDATMLDAKQVGLTDTVRVLGNGTAIAGTSIPNLPADIRGLLESADVIISKGQGNYETLCYSDMNIYYIFMCKCDMYSERFGVPKLTPMLINDKRSKI